MGAEHWTYNDALNSPEMRKWLGKVVGTEADDLSRHDKWLSMTYPQMMLLREFLRSDGARRLIRHAAPTDAAKNR
jgi:hypothetical protein